MIQGFLTRNVISELDIRDLMEENPIRTILRLGAKNDAEKWLIAYKVVIVPSEEDEERHWLKAFSSELDEDDRPVAILDLPLTGLRMGPILLGASYYYAHLAPIEHDYSLSGIEIPGEDVEEFYPKIAGQRLEITLLFP